MPSALGSVATGLKPTMTGDEYRNRRHEIRDNLFEQYGGREKITVDPLTRENPPTKVTSTWSEVLWKEALAHERLNEEHLNDQIAQIRLARNITRISPASIVQYAIQSLAGTGFSRHSHFLDQVRKYATGVRAFLIETDRSDSESPHAIGVKEGASEKSVNFEAIPKFEDTFSLGEALDAAVVDILLLFLFLVVLLASAYLSFLRVDV